MTRMRMMAVLIPLLLLGIGGAFSHGANASATFRVVDGSGTGSVICALTSHSQTASITLHSEQFGPQGPSHGTYTVSTGVVPDYRGTVTSMRMPDAHSYSLSAEIAPTLSACATSTTTTITISGLCGTSVTISFQTNDPTVSGTFTGNVDCTFK